jgi:hypothetical protein
MALELLGSGAQSSFEKKRQASLGGQASARKKMKKTALSVVLGLLLIPALTLAAPSPSLNKRDSARARSAIAQTLSSMKNQPRYTTRGITIQSMKVLSVKMGATRYKVEFTAVPRISGRPLGGCMGSCTLGRATTRPVKMTVSNLNVQQLLRSVLPRK